MDETFRQHAEEEQIAVYESYDDILAASDAVYIVSHPEKHYSQIKQALEQGVHV
ncbi:MAG: Gfo/Idh/MocA family oxidoreductase, partial [Akkermansia sp.]|nr:Gfo/Idh/MocA family oxidoreductase [Akkermansia sp.]